MNTRHWAEIGEYSAVWGMRLLLALFRLGGRPIVQCLLYPIVAYYWLVNRAGRAASRAYLARVARLDPNARAACSFRHFMAFAEAILDKLVAWTGGIALQDVDYRGREAVVDYLRQGQGVLLLGSHLGNLDVCRVIARLQPGVAINVLVHTRHAEKFNALLNRYNPDSRLNLLQVTDVGAATAMLLADKIEQGELVIVAADRTPVGNAPRVSEAHFLGDRAAFPQGPFILAALLKCPVFTVFCLKQRGRHAIYFDPFSNAMRLPKGRRAEALQAEIQRYADVLQRYCLREPLQWFNFYDFWRLT